MASPDMVTTGDRPPAARGGRSPMRSPVTWIIVLGIALAGGAYLLFKRSQASTATATTTDATPAGTTTPDWSGEIATLQTEIMDLQSTAAQDEAGEGTTKTTGAPGDVHAVKVTETTIEVGWTKAENATAYQVRIAGRGPSKPLVTTRTITGLSTTFTGLRANTPYAIDVQAMPAGGTGTISVTTKAAPAKPTRPGQETPGSSSPTEDTQAAHTSKPGTPPAAPKVSAPKPAPKPKPAAPKPAAKPKAA